MAHFAEVDEYTNIVRRVIVAEQEFIDSGLVGDPKTWVQCSYNTRGGVYHTPNTNDPDPDQSKALRKNFPGIGYIYNKELDGFHLPQPYPSYTLNPNSCLWEAPIPYPDDGKRYKWNETDLTWDELIIQD